MRPTPHTARMYLLVAAFLIALPTLGGLYRGRTGMLLVATDRVPDGTPFYRTVVYVAKHDLFQAYGYVVNIPEPLDRTEGETPPSLPVFYGGPVGHPGTVALMGRDEMAPRLAFTPEDGKTLRQGRVLSGYAGWAPLQLDYEIARKRWIVIDYDPVLIFDDPPEKMWIKALRRGQAGTGRIL